MWFLRKREAMLGEHEIQKKSILVQRKIVSLTSVKEEGRGVRWCSHRAREAILGASQAGEKAAAAILSGQQGGNQAVTGKCCRKTWETAAGLVPGNNLRGRQAAVERLLQLCHTSHSEGIMPALTQQLPTMATSHGMEAGWARGMPPGWAQGMPPFSSMVVSTFSLFGSVSCLFISS